MRPPAAFDPAALTDAELLRTTLEDADFRRAASAARELTRVAVAETESDWLQVASGKTVHQLEALVAGKSPGDKCVVTSTGTYTVTGGAGAFANATGSGTISTQFDPCAGTAAGTYTGRAHNRLEVRLSPKAFSFVPSIGEGMAGAWPAEQKAANGTLAIGPGNQRSAKSQG